MFQNMDVGQKVSLGLVGVLGLVVLLSYVPIGKEQMSGTHDYWVGFNNESRYMFYGLQIGAAIGFLVFLFTYCFNKRPSTGLFSKHISVAPILIGLLLLSSIGWSVGMMYSVRNPQSVALKGVVSASLIVTAICSILLLAGYAEADNSKWYGLLGIMFFCLVTVLADGVAWNAKYILS